MKLIKDLFQQLSIAIDISLALFDESNNFITATEESKYNREDYNYIYPIELQEETCLFLASRDVIKPETLALIKLMLIQAYSQANIYSREEILLSILKGENDPLMLKKAQQQLFKYSNSYRVAFLTGERAEELLEIFTLLEEVYKGDNQIILAYTDDGIIMLVIDEIRNPIQIATQVRDTINSELLIDLKITISSPYHKVEEIYRALGDLHELNEIGNIFFPGRHILISDEMKLEQLIYSVPFEQREKIYIELFKKDIYDKMEEDLYHTIEVFINNDLSLSETAAKLYIHRNTLNYRLDKLQRETGLDLRKFNDAMYFKICWLLKKSIIK